MSEKRILFVKLAAIGDVVLSLPAFARVREENPEAKITWLVGHAAALLLQHQPGIDEVFSIDENIFWKKKPMALARLFVKLRARNFDRVFILHWSPWFHRYFWLLGIPDRIGFAREGASFRLTQSAAYLEGEASLHDVNQYLHMVSPSLAATGKVERPPVLHFSAAERTAFDERSRGWRSPSEGPWIAVAPGGGNNPKLVMPQKRWPKQQMSELVARLVEREKATVFLLGDRTERALLEGLAERSPHQVVLLAGELSLRETAQLIEKCRLFIGNDSGLLHVSAAVGRPSVSFFGPTSPHGKIPEWVPHRVLYTKEICSPCYRYGSAPPCPYDLRCLRNITVDQAEAQVRELLGSAHG